MTSKHLDRRHFLQLASAAAALGTLGLTSEAEAAARRIDPNGVGKKLLINSRLVAIDKRKAFAPSGYERTWWPKEHEMKRSNGKLTSWAQSTKGVNHAYGVWGLQDTATRFEVELKAREGEFGLQVCTYTWTGAGRRSYPKLSELRLAKNHSTTVRSESSKRLRVDMPSARRQYLSLIFVSPSAYTTTSKFYLGTRHVRFR